MDLKSWHFKYIDLESKSKSKFNFPNTTLGCFKKVKDLNFDKSTKDFKLLKFLDLK